MKYPKYERLVVTVFPEQLEFLNRRVMEFGLNRSVSVREALNLLITKDYNAMNKEVKPNEPQN